MNYDMNLLFLLTCLGLGLGCMTDWVLTTTSKYFGLLENHSTIKNIFVGSTSGVIGGNAVFIYSYLDKNLVDQLRLYLDSYVFIPTIVYMLYTSFMLYQSKNSTDYVSSVSPVPLQSQTQKYQFNDITSIQKSIPGNKRDNDLMARFWDNQLASSTYNSPNF